MSEAAHRGTVLVVTTASGGLAITYPVLGLIALVVLLPLGQTSSAGPGALGALAEHGTGWWLTTRWLFLVTSLLGLGLVVGLRARAGVLAAAVFLLVAVFEGSWTSVVAGIGALTLAPSVFGALAVLVHRWPEPPGAGACGRTARGNRRRSCDFVLGLSPDSVTKSSLAAQRSDAEQ